MKRKSIHLLFILFVLLSLVLACKNQSSQSNAKSETSEWLDLFNGEDLSGWYTYQKQPEPTSEVPELKRDEEGKYLDPIGLDKDPLKVFTVVREDGEPALRLSGEVFGILVTEKEYENYHLKLEFKWGDEKFPPRMDKKMDSGILYHSVGPEGAWGGVWMKSLECQVQQTDCGDYISVDTVLADVAAFKSDADGRFYHSPNADVLTFDPARSYCNKSKDYENPTGEWNTMEIYTAGGKSIHVVNGKVNMRVSNSRQVVNGKEVPLTKGKIQLQSEGAEIFYRNIKIKPINEVPDDSPEIFNLWKGETKPFYKENTLKEYEEEAWGTRCVFNITEPTLTVYKAQGENSGKAVVIIPGGGYSLVAMYHEGYDLAEALSREGITAAVLKYRLPNPASSDQPHLVPITDARKALKMMRQKADFYGFSKSAVGVIGFSAGSHLSTVASLWESEDVEENPNFSALIYGVTNLSEGNKKWLEEALYYRKLTDEELVKNTLLDLVSEKTPPAFLVHAYDDNVCKVEETTLYARKLIDHGVMVETHLFPKGGHGFGMGRKEDGTDQWVSLFVNWVKLNNFK